MFSEGTWPTRGKASVCTRCTPTPPSIGLAVSVCVCVCVCSTQKERGGMEEARMKVKSLECLWLCVLRGRRERKG